MLSRRGSPVPTNSTTITVRREGLTESPVFQKPHSLLVEVVFLLRAV
jgi:hypothetical protein